MKTVCFFGNFDPGYIRNVMIHKILVKAGFEVIDCYEQGGGFIHYLNLWQKFIINYRNCDYIWVGFFGHYDVLAAWVLGKIFKKGIIFDAFISVYDTYIFDRQIYSEHSFAAKKYYLWDYISCHLADLVLLDTKNHANFFIKQFKLKKTKVNWIYIGADEDFFIPTKSKNKKFIVEFHGSYQPLQGVDNIIEAAALVPEYINFILIGDGQTKKKAQKRAKELRIKNIKFYPMEPLVKIRENLSKADICLGIFGITRKSDLVIPNKLYESIAMGKPVITKNSPAVKELFVNKKNCLLLDKNNPQVLADAINLLYNNPKLREKIGLNARQLYLDKLTTKKLSITAKRILKRININKL